MAAGPDSAVFVGVILGLILLVLFFGAIAYYIVTRKRKRTYTPPE